MYSILNVVLGIPMTMDLVDYVNESRSDEEWEWEDLGFEELYHGSSDYAGYCGVLLKEVHLTGDPFLASDLSVVASEEQQAEALNLVKEIPEDVREHCQPFGLYIVESTS